MSPLATSQNSGIPAAFSRKEKPAKDATSLAAGVLFVTPQGKALFLRRAENGEWSLPFGGVDGDEDFIDAALREVTEETGHTVDGAVHGVYRTNAADCGGLDAVTFVNEVDEEFEPVLNDEHDQALWAPLDAVPQPVHFGLVQALEKFFDEEADEGEHDSGSASEIAQRIRLQRRIDADREFAKLAGDGKAEHEVFIRYNGDFPFDKFLKNLHRLGAVGASRTITMQDENDEEIPVGWDGDGADRIIEATVDGRNVIAQDAADIALDRLPPGVKTTATDAALVLAIDRESVRDFDKDNRLHVAMTNVSKANVCPYRGEEIPGWEELGLDPHRIYRLLRAPEELKKAAPTFNRLPLLRQHVPVSADDHQPTEVVGATGSDCEFHDPYLTNSLVVWAKDSIDAIENKARAELSAGYHYRADMTPGNFGGIPYDGVMRDVVGNHVALVETGRAGPDVVVADSMESFMITRPTRIAAVALDLTLRGVRPLLAQDQKVNLLPLFDGVTSKNLKERRKSILEGVRANLKGRTIAQDAQLDHVEELLDRLEKAPLANADESVSEEQHNAMAAAANGESNLGIPKDVGEEYLDADKGKTFDEGNFREVLKSKGLADDDIEEIVKLLPSAPAAKDEDPDDEKVKKDSDEDKEKAMGKDEMNAAIAAAVKTERKRGQEIRVAFDEVRPYVGDLPSSLAFDSAVGVYQHSLKMLGVDDAEEIKELPALRAILKLQPRAGIRASEKPAHVATDSAGVKSFNEFYPGADRIGVA